MEFLAGQREQDARSLKTILGNYRVRSFSRLAAIAVQLPGCIVQRGVGPAVPAEAAGLLDCGLKTCQKVRGESGDIVCQIQKTTPALLEQIGGYLAA